MHGYYPPPPWYYQQPPTPTSDRFMDSGYIKFLKKELKEAKKSGKKPEDKKEEKKMWWKRLEITTALFFLSPFIFIAYLGILKISWMLAKSLVN